MEKKNYTTYEISAICGVSMPTIIGWIESGRLAAFKTLGGHRRVKKEVLLRFLEENHFPLPDDLRASAKKKILIVDDQPEIVEYIQRVLKKLTGGFEIVTASDGFQAGQSLSDSHPDLVILDIFLPGVDGYKVCELIRKKNATIKIIAITGKPSPEAKEKMLAAGADAFLAKPFTGNDLLEHVKRLLSLEK